MSVRMWRAAAAARAAAPRRGLGGGRGTWREAAAAVAGRMRRRRGEPSSPAADAADAAAAKGDKGEFELEAAVREGLAGLDTALERARDETAAEWRRRLEEERARVDAAAEEAAARARALAAEAEEATAAAVRDVQGEVDAAAARARALAAEAEEATATAVRDVQGEVDAALDGLRRAVDSKAVEWRRRVERAVLPEKDALLKMAECVSEVVEQLRRDGGDAAGAPGGRELRVADVLAGLLVAATSEAHKPPSASGLGLARAPGGVALAHSLLESALLCHEGYGSPRAPGSPLGHGPNAWREVHRESATVLRPAFSVSVRGDGSAAAVVVRGTHEASDVATDVTLRTVPYGGGGCGLAHLGVVEGTRAVHRLLRDSGALELALSSVSRGADLVVTGHSLGGGVASLLAERLRADPAVTARVDVRCHTFGSIAAVSEEPAARMEGHTVAVVLGCDAVPRLCLTNVLRLRDAVAGLHFSDEVRRRLIGDMESAWNKSAAARRQVLDRYVDAAGATAKSANELFNATLSRGAAAEADDEGDADEGEAAEEGRGKKGGASKAKRRALVREAVGGARSVRASFVAEVERIQEEALRDAAAESLRLGESLRDSLASGAAARRAGDAAELPPRMFPGGSLVYLEPPSKSAGRDAGLYPVRRDFLDDLVLHTDMYLHHRLSDYAAALGAALEAAAAAEAAEAARRASTGWRAWLAAFSRRGK